MVFWIRLIEQEILVSIDKVQKQRYWEKQLTGPPEIEKFGKAKDMATQEQDKRAA